MGNLKVRPGYAPQVGNPFVPAIDIRPNIHPDAFGASLGRALSQLGGTLQAKMEAQTAADNDFQTKKLVLDETLYAQGDLVKREGEAPSGAQGFTLGVLNDYTERHNKILDDLRQQGMSEDVIRGVDLKLMSLRGEIASKAMTFQQRAWEVKAKNDSAAVADTLGNTLTYDPYLLDQSIEDLNASIDAIDGLDPAVRDNMKADLAQTLRLSAGLSLANKDPSRVKGLLEGRVSFPTFFDAESQKQLTGVSPTLLSITTAAEAHLPEGWSFQVGDRTHGKGGVGGKGTSAQQAEIVARGDSKTMNSRHIDGVAIDLTPYYNGEPVETDEAFNIIQEAMRQGAADLNVEVEWGGNWKNFSAGGPDKYHYQISKSYLGSPVVPVVFVGAMKKGIYSAETPGDATPYDARGPWIKRRTGQDRAYGKYQVMGANIGPWTKAVTGRAATADEFLANPQLQEAVFEDQMTKLYNKYGNVRDAASVWFTGDTYDKAVARKATDGHWTVQQYVARVEDTIRKGGSAIDVGDPVLNKLTPDERRRVLAQATTGFNQNQAVQRAQLDLDESNAFSAFEAGMPYNGQRPTQARYFDAYGPDIGEQKWAAFQQAERTGEAIGEMATLSPAEIDKSLQEAKPTDTSSPTFGVENAGYQARQKAAASILQARETDPAAYVMQRFPAVTQAWANAQDTYGRQLAFAQMARAYDKLGIPESKRAAFPEGAITNLKDRLSSQTPEKTIEDLVNLHRELGSLFYNGLRQMEENGMPVQAYLAGLVAMSPGHQGIAANVLRGLAILKEDKTYDQKTSTFNTEFRTRLGAAQLALPPSTIQSMSTSAMALYAFMGGQPDPYASGQTDLYKQALNLVVGGSMSPDTGIVDLSHGRSPEPTILPPTVTRDEFRRWMDNATPEEYQALGGEPYYSTGDKADPDEIAREGVFVRIGAEQYMVKMGSDGLPLMTNDNRPYIVTLTPSIIRNGAGKSSPSTDDSLRPFAANEFVKNEDGTISTERSRTVMIDGVWTNVPSLWMGKDGPMDYGDLSDYQLADLAKQFETRIGKKFPRFGSVNEATDAAIARSKAGGAAAGSNLK